MGCKVCKHKDREKIERLLRSGYTPRDIAEPYESISASTVQRHRKFCMNKKKDEPVMVELTQKSDIDKAVTQQYNPLDIILSIDGAERDAIDLFEQLRGAGNLMQADSVLNTRLKALDLKIKLATVMGLFDRNVVDGESMPVEETETIPPGVLELM